MSDDRLWELVERWRDTDGVDGLVRRDVLVHRAKRECADELEAVLEADG